MERDKRGKHVSTMFTMLGLVITKPMPVCPEPFNYHHRESTLSVWRNSILHQTFKLGIKIIMVKCKMSALGSIKCKVPCWDGKDGHWTNDCLLNDQLLLAFSSAHRSWAASQLGGVPHTVWTHRSRFPLISDTEIFSVWATSVTCKGRVWFLNPCHWYLLFPEFFL